MSIIETKPYDGEVELAPLIQVVGKFSKISEEQFSKDISICSKGTSHITDEMAKEAYETVTVPVRATRGSAGYDFKSPISFELYPSESIVIPTGITAEITDGWVLAIFPRSGLGFRYHARLANTVGIIDSDYHYSDNEGHIMLKIVNEGSKKMEINAGDGIAQGIFLQFGIVSDDNVVAERNGGFGSTGR